MQTPWAWLRSIFAGRRGENPHNQERFLYPYPVAGVYLNADESLSLAAVWACIDIIAKSIASQQWNIYEQIPGVTRKRKLLFDDMRTYLLNTRPNPEMTAIGFREAMLFQAIPFGNAYAEIVRDTGGRVAQLWPLMSDRMRPRRNENWVLEYEYVNPDGSSNILPSSRVLHLRGPGLWGLMGENIVARAAKTLGLLAAQERFSSSFFGQGAQPIGVLTFPGRLDDVTYGRLKQDWADKYKGPDNAHKPLILEGGMKFEATSIDPQKAQFTEGKYLSLEDVCRWFGVPPHKIHHLLRATYSNIEHSSIEFVRDGLQPWERRLCQEADFKLFDQTRAPWRTTEIDLRPLTRGDAQSRALAQASWRQNGVMNANEIRAMEGLDDIGPDGDVFIVQSNMTTIEQIQNPPEPTPRALPTPPQEDGDEGEDEDENEETDDDASRAVVAAVQSGFARFYRRLKNRRAALSKCTVEERVHLLNEYSEEQYAVMLEELSFFNALTRKVLGREISREDLRHIDRTTRSSEGVNIDVLQLLSTNERKIHP